MSVTPAPTTEWAGPKRQHLLVAASPVTYVTSSAPPFLLIHGTADVIVGYAQSEVLAQALTDQGASARLVPIEGADHIFNGHDDIDGIVRLSVDYLAEALHSGSG
jgi:dipeptidyl aminopeptidase/acylaminoacyl peptidase